MTRTGGLLVVLTVMALAATAMAVTKKSEGELKVVRAEQFELVDKEGKVRLFINLNREGDPTIALLDKKGEVRASLGMNKNAGPILLLEDQGQVAFLDSKRARRLLLSVNSKNSPRIEIIDEEDKTKWTAP